MAAFLQLVLGIAVSLAAFLGLVSSRQVEVDVSANWPQFSSSFVSEIAELLADHSKPLYWEFLNQLCEISDISTPYQNQSSILNAKALEIALGLLPNSLHSVTETKLGLNYYTPSVQFYLSANHIYRDLCNGQNVVVLEYPGEIVHCGSSFDWATNPQGDNLYDHLSYEWEHVYPSSSPSADLRNKPYALLLGSYGAPSFCSQYSRLKADTLTGTVAGFAVRPSFHGLKPIASEVKLHGYGVFLDIKNMEYKNVDESKEVQSDSNGEVRDEKHLLENEEIQGINFKRLLDKNPSLKSEVFMLRDVLVKSEQDQDGRGSGEGMKVWKMKDFGLQVLQLISSVAAKESAVSAMTRLKEFVQNFPRYAPMISSTKVTARVKNELNNFYQSMFAATMPLNSLYINSQRIDLSSSTFNLFDVLQTVQQEIEAVSALKALKFSSAINRLIKQAILSADDQDDPSGMMGGADPAAALEKEITRIDVSKGGKFVVHFLNNLEKDKIYKQWPKTLTTLLYPSWNLHTIARNLYTLIVNVDALSEDGLSLLSQVKMLQEESLPIRFGVVLSCSSNGNEPDRVQELRKNVCRLYSSLSEQVPSAVNFLETVGTAFLSEGDAVDVDRLVELYLPFTAASGKSSSKKWFSSGSDAKKAAEIKEMLVSTAQHLDFVTNSTEYFAERNLPANSFSLNGIVSLDVSLTNSLMRLLGREQFLLSSYVRNKQLTDKSKSIFADIMRISKAFARYHPMLDEKDPEFLDFSKSPAARDFLKEKLSFFTPFLPSEVTNDEDFESAYSLLSFLPMNARGLEVARGLLDWQLRQLVDGRALSRPTQVAWLWLAGDSSLCGAQVCPASANGMEIVTALSAVQRIFLEQVGDFQGTCGRLCTESLFEVVQFALGQEATPSACSLLELLLAWLDQRDSSSFAGLDRAGLSAAVREALGTLSVASELRLVEEQSRLAVQALGLTKDLALQAPQAQRALLVFNGRKLFLDGAASFHPTDLELLGQLEEKRVGSRAFDELFREMERRERSSRPQSGLADQLQRFRAASFQRALLSSYVLAKRRASGGSRAVDVGEVIRSSFPEDSSALLYQLEAPASDYWDNANDLEIFFMLDPLSTGGQRAVSLIELFREHLHFSLTALVVPRPETTEFPLQNFYRFVSAPHLAHSVPATDAGEGETAAEFVGASFTQLPRQHVLTTRVDIPEPWNVQTARAVQDIDNLRCSAQRCGDSLAEGERARDLTRVGYTLKNLLVAGQCFQAEADQVERLGSPPNGLQLTLSSLGQTAAATVSDTLVMQNLGYYQLQAQPGLYLLRLAEGRASDLFTIKDTELLGGRIIAVKSFGDLIRRLLVVKRRGFEQFSLLDDTPLPTADQDAAESAVVSAGGASFWQRVTSSLSLFSGEPGAGAGAGAVTGPGAVSEDDKIHIFSLATGHLYERFLRIMMLSVVKHSSRPVKFWLFENYLSPKFKQIAQLMSRRYGFEVGYVTYKWPQWLRQQTQQQRIIWGYKILFLDVLFPLHLKKVIYVDADQVVRSDLAELWDLDLEGAPYGYTPFCTSRQETLGFQFWRQGYWKDHLQGRPYHISALYVVDLQTFRRQVVGDTLRAIYDQLSRDPNSLANLDQDLPNYAQHQVPIFSLPQSFLWCESWCSDKSKSQAKTIDLCNNPLHKEPKLEMAKRIISGKLFNQSWVELDEEIQQVVNSSGIEALLSE